MKTLIQLGPDVDYDRRQLRDRLSTLLLEQDNLESRRATLLRFGCGDGKERTLNEVGKELGVCVERARQRIDNTLGLLRVRCKRCYLHRYQLNEYLDMPAQQTMWEQLYE